MSNFDRQLLEEIGEISTIRPHLIQNFAEPGATDAEVRAWCDENYAIYQPYASLRNLAALRPPYSESLRKIAATHGVSEYTIVLKFFIQTEAVVIPRAKNTQHLQSNLQVMSLNFDLTPAEMASLGWII